MSDLLALSDLCDCHVRVKPSTGPAFLLVPAAAIGGHFGWRLRAMGLPGAAASPSIRAAAASEGRHGKSGNFMIIYSDLDGTGCSLRCGIGGCIAGPFVAGQQHLSSHRKKSRFSRSARLQLV